MLNYFFIICILALLLILLYYFYSYVRFAEFLKDIDKVFKSVRYGDLQSRINTIGKGLIGQLSYNLNNMLESFEDRENMIKSYQLELADKNEYMAAIFDSLADGVVIVDDNCNVINANPAIVKWVGCKEKILIGKKLSFFLKYECKIDCANIDEGLEEICPLISEQSQKLPKEAKIINLKNKTERILDLASSKIPGTSKDNRYVITLRDITEYKEMDKIREDFIATLTHDLRVPMIAETNTLKFLLKGTFGQLNNKQQEAIDNILESNSDLIRMVNSLLDTYKYESGRYELYKEITNMHRLAQDCINEFLSLAEKNNHIIKNSIPDDIQEIFIDKTEIKRVLRNLINNSISYTQPGGVIELKAHATPEEFVLKITDNGRGISEKDLGMIFDRFYSQAKKFRKIGTGLGLYLSKQIIERHNGQIWVNSIKGKGSTFYFSLPFDNQK